MRVLYFAWVREAIGLDEEEVAAPPGMVSDLIDHLASRSDGHASAFRDRARLRAAVDGRFVPLDTPTAGATEVAIFPPVTGG